MNAKYSIGGKEIIIQVAILDYSRVEVAVAARSGS